MEIKYSSHAVSRMMERDISNKVVESIIKDPEDQIKQSRDKEIVFKSIRGRNDNKIAAVIVRSKHEIEVITVMVNFEVR